MSWDQNDEQWAEGRFLDNARWNARVQDICKAFYPDDIGRVAVEKFAEDYGEEALFVLVRDE